MPVTPIGTAVYPHLSSPDTKFDENGVYQLQLSLTEEEASGLAEALTSRHASAYAKHLEETGKPKLKKADLPWTEEFDDSGKETGNILFRFKMKAKTAKGIELRPTLVDAKLAPVTEMIGSGSKCKVAYDVHDWFVPALGVGISLRLKGVQVIELIEYSGGRSAKGCGFGEEEGFETAAAALADASEDSGDDSDF